MKKNIVIILLSIVILGLGGYLVYDKVIDKEESNDLTENINEKVITDEEAYNIGKSLFEFGHSALWCNEYKYSETYVDGLGFEVLNYEEVKSKFTSNNQVQYTIIDSSESYNKFGYSITNVDGKYYDNSRCGRGANLMYISTELELVEKENNSITFNAVSKYCDVPYIDSTTNCNNIETKIHQFKIEKEDEFWKIAKITNPR